MVLLSWFITSLVYILIGFKFSIFAKLQMVTHTKLFQISLNFTEKIVHFVHLLIQCEQQCHGMDDGKNLFMKKFPNLCWWNLISMFSSFSSINYLDSKRCRNRTRMLHCEKVRLTYRLRTRETSNTIFKLKCYKWFNRAYAKASNKKDLKWKM